MRSQKKGRRDRRYPALHFELAEYGFEVYKSAVYLEELLEKEGFTVEQGIGGMETAFVGTYGSGKPVIGILAEYDALPNMSQKAGETKPCPIEGKKYRLPADTVLWQQELLVRLSLPRNI